MNLQTNPFDPAALRLDQSFVNTLGVKRLLTTVSVRKPTRQDWIRVHPDPDYRLTAAINREVYVVTPDIASEIPGEFSAATLYTAVNRQGVLSLWPVRLPAPDGKINEWHRSAGEAAERAMHRWTRLAANMALGSYDQFEAIGNISEPVWPEISFQEILQVAFRDHIVDRIDHPLILRLQGAA